jgi:hypothetical protein
MKLSLFLMVFVNVHIHFRIWTRIRNPQVTVQIRIHNTVLDNEIPVPVYH